MFGYLLSNRKVWGLTIGFAAYGYFFLPLPDVATRLTRPRDAYEPDEFGRLHDNPIDRCHHWLWAVG